VSFLFKGARSGELPNVSAPEPAPGAADARTKTLLVLATSALGSAPLAHLYEQASAAISRALGIPREDVLTSASPARETSCGASWDAPSAPRWGPPSWALAHESSPQPSASSPARMAPLALEVAVEAHGRVVGRLGVRALTDRSLSAGAADFLQQTARILSDACERRAELERERARADAAERRGRLLAHASVLLRPYDDAIQAAAEAAKVCVPAFTDWCFVDVLRDDRYRRRIERIAVQHADPVGEGVAADLARRYPRNPDLPHPAPKAIRTGRPELREVVTDAFLREIAEDDKHLHLLRTISPRSYICVPLAAGGSPMGAMSFVSTDAEKTYDRDDLLLAEAIAQNTAFAMDTAGAARAASAAGSRPVLTYRQIEVLTLVGRNMTTSQIARHLALSEPAVKKHLKGANERLGARSRREAVSIARELGLIPPG
jgi:DNA-binding CsgD family transcriptional regulator